MPMKLNRNKLHKMGFSSFLEYMKVSRQSSEASESTKHFKSYMFGTSGKVFPVDQSCTTDDLEWTNQITECPVYHPSMEEFEDPLDYLQKIAPEASQYGVCKIVPPLISTVPTGVVMMKEKPGFRFTPKVQPLWFAGWPISDKSTFLISGKSYTLRDFEVMANRTTASKYFLSGCLPSACLEREFWHEMTCGTKRTVEYGIDLDGSAFSSSSNDHLGNSKWNLKKLPRLPRSALRLVENAIPGVTDPMMYIGMLFSMFAWHVEDHYLYSINYHHCGAPKTWYGVPGGAANEFEKVIQHHVCAREILPTDGADGAFELLAEKTTMFPPKILLQNHVPVYKVVQLPGEFVITFPRAYHAGFSHGFNCGEAVNFAASDWFPFGEAAIERYARLRKAAIVPYEEILCKEALLLSSKTCPKDDDHVVKASFASLMRKHDGALLWLKSLDESLSISPGLNETISCSLCKRECYVAHVDCNCRADPICIFHDTELSICRCGSKRVLSLRQDLPQMQDVVKMFDAEKHMKQDNCISYGGNRYDKARHGSGWVGYADTKIHESNTCRESQRSRKLRTSSGKNNVKVEVVDVATRAITTGKSGKRGISSSRLSNRARSSSRVQELKKKRRKRASQCHLCRSKIAL